MRITACSDGEPGDLRAAACRRGGAGEAAGASGLAGAGDLAGGAGAVVRVAGPPGGGGGGRSLSVWRWAGNAAGGGAAALDQVQDPRNLGAICRSAEFAGAAGLVIPERRSAAITAATCKTSAGAVEHIEVAHVRNLSDWLAEAKAAGFWIWGADAEAEQTPWSVDLTGSTVIVLGGEGKGLRPRVASNCDGLVALPQLGQVESLNVSAAATALLFEAVRQRSS